VIKLVYIVRKRDEITFKDFSAYWLEKHGPLVRSFAKVIHARKYVQSHTVAPEVGGAIAQSRGMPPGFDGITEVWWDSLDEVNAGFSTPEGREAGRVLTEDEARFIDLKRSYIFLTEEHTIFDFTAKPS
jgi:uncharacterized protein (TIGR02118 family)